MLLDRNMVCCILRKSACRHKFTVFTKDELDFEHSII